MSSIEDFLRWYNNTNITPTSEAVQKLLVFYQNKKKRFVNASLYITKSGQHLSTQFFRRKNLSPQRRRKTPIGRNSKNWWCIFTRIQLLKPLFANQQSYANQASEMMLANYTSTPYVNPCQPDFIPIAISIPNQ